MIENKGRVHVFTGNGRGKTSACIGTAVRAAGYGLRVKMFFFLKVFHEGGEYASFDKLGVDWRICCRPDGFGAAAVKEKDVQDLQSGLYEVEHDFIGQHYDLIILDEINIACNFKMISIKELIDLLEKRGNTEVIISGRYADPLIVEYADQVSSIESIKHARDKGGKPKPGIDY